MHSPDDRAQVTAEDGWFLAKRSWRFHRSIWRKVGRTLEFGEYAAMLHQIRSGQAELIRFGDQGALYRVTLRDGTTLQIRVWDKLLKNGKRFLDLIDVHARQPAKPPVPQPEVAPPSPPWPPPPPPPQPALVLRASTLTLGAKASDAAGLLADRLRPVTPPPRLEKPAPTAKKKRAR